MRFCTIGVVQVDPEAIAALVGAKTDLKPGKYAAGVVVIEPGDDDDVFEEGHISSVYIELSERVSGAPSCTLVVAEDDLERVLRIAAVDPEIRERALG